MLHRNERCRPSRPPPTGPPMLRAEESSPQGLIVVGPVRLNTYNWRGENDARSSSGSARQASSRGPPPGYHRRSARRRPCQFASDRGRPGDLHRIRLIRARRSGQAPSRDSFRVGSRVHTASRHVTRHATESPSSGTPSNCSSTLRPTYKQPCPQNSYSSAGCEVRHGQLSVEYR